jgi:hypothetical protein
VRRLYRAFDAVCVDTVDDDVARCMATKVLPPSNTTTMLAIADGFMCGLKVNGAIECWGALTASAPQGAYRQIVAGRRHACALDFQDRAVCWGEAGAGQLEAPPDLFRALSASQDHTCGLTRTGRVMCWGDSGVWGSWPAPTGWFVEVVAGALANCAVTQEGTVSCWGQGKVVSVPAPSGINRLSVGESRACGLDSSGQPVCWGEPMTATLPRGPLRAIDVGPSTCVIRADGQLVCVGETLVNADHSLR